MIKQRGELDPTQGQQEPTVPVVSDPEPTDADLVPDNEDVPEVEPSSGLNAGGAFGHTPDHGDASASVLAADHESEGAEHDVDRPEPSDGE